MLSDAKSRKRRLLIIIDVVVDVVARVQLRVSSQKNDGKSNKSKNVFVFDFDSLLFLNSNTPATYR